MKRNLDPEEVKLMGHTKKTKSGDVKAADHPEHSTIRTTVHDLPPELLMEVFSCFSIKELCLTVAPVCKIWHLVSQHPCLWKHLSFEDRRVTTERLCSLLSNATQLQSLQLVGRLDATAVLRQVSLSNQSIQILIVKRCTGSMHQIRIQAQVLLQLIKRCSKLVEITIKETQFYSEAFCKNIGIYLPDLKRINLNYNRHLGSRSLSRLACNCKPLEEVCIIWASCFRERTSHLYESTIKDNGINELCTRMKDSLKVLKISAWELTNNAMKSIVQCTCLQTLRIRYALRLSDDGILLLTTLHNLSSLEMSFTCSVSTEAWQELFIRSNWNSMTKLSLNSCGHVNDDVLECIGDTCPNLESVSLSSCKRITNEGLSKIIKGCKKLRFLRVNFTKINVVQCFPLIPRHTPNLRFLICDYINTKVKKRILFEARRMLHSLKRKLPNLTIRTNILP